MADPRVLGLEEEAHDLLENVREEERRKKAELLGLKEEVQGLAEKSRAKEDQLRGALLRQSDVSTDAVDKVLSSLIDQTGYITGLTKQATAHNMASRGILRSGQTTAKLAGADIAKASTVTGLVGQRNQQVGKIREATRQAQIGVQDRRTEIEQKMREAEIAGMSDLAVKEHQMRMKMELEQFITDLQLDSHATQALFAGIGSLASLGGIYAGYHYGASPATGRTSYWGEEGTYGQAGYDYGLTDLSAPNMA